MDQHQCNCDRCSHKMCARKVPIFSVLDDKELLQVVNLIIHREFIKGEMIVMEDEPFENLIIINQGQVKAFKDNQAGKEQILYIFSEGDFFGESSLLRDQKAAYYVEALERTKVCMIKKSEFRNLIKEYPEIGLKIIDVLSTRIDKLEHTIQSMGTNKVESRIATVLLEFANKYGSKKGDGIEFELPLSREGIANYIGLTRETVSRKMNQLQEEGLIEMIGNKKVRIKNWQVVEELSDI